RAERKTAAAGAPTPKDAGPSYVVRVRSGGNDVLGRRALLPLRDVEGHLLALEELAETLGGDVRVVGEHVSAATVLLDEAETLFRVEPLHGSSSHVISPSGLCVGIHPVRTPCRRDDHPAGKPGMHKRFSRYACREERLKFREPQLQLRSTVARWDAPCILRNSAPLVEVMNLWTPRAKL